MALICQVHLHYSQSYSERCTPLSKQKIFQIFFGSIKQLIIFCKEFNLNIFSNFKMVSDYHGSKEDSWDYHLFIVRLVYYIPFLQK